MPSDTHQWAIQISGEPPPPPPETPWILIGAAVAAVAIIGGYFIWKRR